MENILHAASTALGILFTPLRMGYLILGVILGLVIGLIPGLGGIVGLSLLLPFTFNMDPYSAMAILMGLAAAVSHGDVIPAILFGVPGTVGCAATVMDGYPMAKRGEAGRALGAAFNASLLGGLFGCLILAVSIPVIRPVILLFGSPEMLSICVFGMTMVASLSGNAPLKGLTVASFGLLLSMIGDDPQTGTLRYTFDTLYLWDGMPIVPVALGTFAIPELCDIMINRTSIAAGGKIDAMSGQWQGWKDAFSAWFLVLRTSALGTACSMVPGLGASVIDWLAYGHAARTEKGASLTFGKGDVRGVIAAEASTNAREGGSLIPTIAFGVPAHASMAILLGAFLIQGIVPGPDMLGKHLDVTYTIVWSLTLANVFGTMICFMFANQFARISTVRYTLLLPIIMTLVYIGGFEGQHSWGDIITLLSIGTLGWLLKKCGWPRPPLVLGFILGSLVERYTFISVERYGWDWMTNWFVLIMFAMSALGVFQRVFSGRQSGNGKRQTWSFAKPMLSLSAGLSVSHLIVFLIALGIAVQWDFGARLVPEIICGMGILFAGGLTFIELFKLKPEHQESEMEHAAAAATGGQMKMDLHMGYGTMSERQVYGRALGYFGWVWGVLVGAWMIGFLPALFLFQVSFMRFHGKEKWLMALIVSACMSIFIWFVFDYIVNEPWPQTVIGDLFPVLRTFLPWW